MLKRDVGFGYELLAVEPGDPSGLVASPRSGEDGDDEVRHDRIVSGYVHLLDVEGEVKGLLVFMQGQFWLE